MSNTKPLKQPISVLVVIHDGNNNILLLERADKPGFWQSVTGSKEKEETLHDTALREMWEETGIRIHSDGLHDWHHTNTYEIYPHWRHRYPAGTTHNTEHVFSVQIDITTPILLSKEHLRYQWLPATEAAALAFSPSNQAAILKLATHNTTTANQT